MGSLSDAASTAALAEFDKLIKTSLPKSMSQSRVQAVVDSAMACIENDTALVHSMVKHHRKSSASQKLNSFYLVDAIAREARQRVKRAAKEKKNSESGRSTTPPLASTSRDTGLSDSHACSSFLKTLEQMLSKIVVDSWQNGEPQHKEKVRKILDIWQKSGTFSSSALQRIEAKLAAADEAVATSNDQPESTTPIPSPKSGTQTPVHSGLEASASTLTSSLPASVLALLNAQKAPNPTARPTVSTGSGETTKPSKEEEVERAIAQARAGVSFSEVLGRDSLATTLPPAASDPTRTVEPPIALDATQLEMLKSLVGNGVSMSPSAIHTTSASQARSYDPAHGSASLDRPALLSSTPNSTSATIPAPPPNFVTPSFLPPPPPVSVSHNEAPPTSPPFDPTTFIATNPSSWFSLASHLAQTIFDGREPTMGEMMSFVQMTMMRQQQAALMMSSMNVAGRPQSMAGNDGGGWNRSMNAANGNSWQNEGNEAGLDYGTF